MKPIFAIHPGNIRSMNDYDAHYVGAYQLIKLYGLPSNICFIWDEKRPETSAGAYFDDYLHLYPRYNGDYNVARSVGIDDRTDRSERREIDIPRILRRRS